MATLYAKVAGGNWTASTTWSNVSSAGIDDSGPPANGDDVIFDVSSGNVAMNGASNNLKSLTMTGYLGTLSGASQIIMVGTNGATNNVIIDGTITWTGTLNLSPTASAVLDLTSNGKLITAVSIGGNVGGQVVLQDNLSFAVTKISTLTISISSTLNMNGKTISGNSDINRVLLRTDSIGVSRIITVNAGTFANADFKDIAFANGGSNLDLSAITGLSGDCGGNTMSGGGTLTFTTADELFWIGSTGNWSNTAEWSTSSGGAGGARVPLPQDDATFDANSFSGTGFTVTAGGSSGMSRLGKNVSFSAVGADNPTLAFASVATTIFGSLTLASGMTTSGTSTTNFEGRSASTLTTAGVTINNSIVVAVFGSSFTLQDALTTINISHTHGTFATGNFNVTSSSFASNSGQTRTLTLGSSTLTLSGTGNAWAGSVTGITFTANTSTIILTNTTATAKTFVGAGSTAYNNLTITGDDVTITGNNTFNVLALNNPDEAEGVIIGTGSTQTVSDVTTTASSGHPVLLSGVAGGGAETLSKSSGTVCLNYLTVTNITGAGGATWNVGADSTDGGGNSGLNFVTCGGATNHFLCLLGAGT